MKTLTKVRLINWHYLTNETIEIKNNVLLTGQNASGKSTIMDAIMYVITAGDTNFNMAANEKSKRDLKGYVKCKLGLDDKEYLRDGDVTGHVALEFYDEKADKYFTVGCVIDAFGDLMPVKTLFYRVEAPIEDAWFVSPEGLIYSTVIFRKTHPEFEFYLTKKEAKRGFRNAFGSINEDFFKLIPKALAFKPISDVKEFIYQNVLEEKEIDVTAIKDTVRSYKELENTLKLIKNKITDLKDMQVIYSELEKIIDSKNYAEYLGNLFNVQKLNLEIDQIKRDIEKEEVKKSQKEADLRQLDRENEGLLQRSKELYNVLSNDDVFKKNENILREIESRERNIQELEQDNLKFLKTATTFKETVTNLRKRQDKKIFTDLANMSLVNLNQNEVDFTRLKMQEAKNLVDEYKQQANQELGVLNLQKQEIVQEINKITVALRGLSQNKINFPNQVVQVREEIQEGLKRIYNYDIPVFIFAELIEITDPEWVDAIEVYLGNRRFNLIVEPRYFDNALQIFARIKNKYSLYGIGLVNTKQIAKFNTFEKNSIASVITTENEDAKRYVNMTCGNVIMCDNELELENYSRSITKDFLLYSSYTVTSLNPNIDRPFCGKNAYLSQQKLWEDKAKDAKGKYLTLSANIQALEEQIRDYSSLNFQGILVGLEGSLRLEYEKDTLKGLYIQKEHIDTNATKELEQDYNYVQVSIKNNANKKNAVIMDIGRCEQSIDNLRQRLVDVVEAKTTEEDKLEDLATNNISIKEKAQGEYNELTKNRSFKEAFNEYISRYKSDDKSFDNLSDALIAKQYKYINDYDSTFSVGINEMKSYFAELNKLEKSELVKYEQKVRTAREEAELIFKEDFIAKLRANIEQAEMEIAKINDTLSKITFGNDTYEFVFPKSSEYAQFYEMVTADIDDDNPGSGLFTSSFEAKYEAQIKELFDSLSVDEINSHGAINKFTDYRTYMDYDIKITNKDGESMSYSKVFKEKSGGETQVPFYVAIIASFVRVYTKTNAFNGDPIGIVMFDEVFDKMDANRMKAMMNFITSMPIQTIIACPPQRMTLLEEYADTILLMTRQGTKAQVIPYVKK